MTHFNLWYTGVFLYQKYKFACGQERGFLSTDPASSSASNLEFVNCPDCLASQAYRETVLEIAIAYDGNSAAWVDSKRELVRQAYEDMCEREKYHTIL